MKISISDTCTAFEDVAIGSKVSWKNEFLSIVEKAILKHDFKSDRIPGQALLILDEDAKHFVRSGQGTHSNNPNDYVLREYRGRVHAFLKKHRVGPVVEVAVVAYTKEAYLRDPDIFERGNEEYMRIYDDNPDYVIVAVLASSVKGAMMSPYRFVKNLAGGNYEALVWTADEIRAKAKEISEQVDTWGTVAD